MHLLRQNIGLYIHWRNKNRPFFYDHDRQTVVRSTSLQNPHSLYFFPLHSTQLWFSFSHVSIATSAAIKPCRPRIVHVFSGRFVIIGNVLLGCVIPDFHVPVYGTKHRKTQSTIAALSLSLPRLDPRMAQTGLEHPRLTNGIDDRVTVEAENLLPLPFGQSNWLRAVPRHPRRAYVPPALYFFCLTAELRNLIWHLFVLLSLRFFLVENLLLTFFSYPRLGRDLEQQALPRIDHDREYVVVFGKVKGPATLLLRDTHGMRAGTLADLDQ